VHHTRDKRRPQFGSKRLSIGCAFLLALLVAGAGSSPAGLVGYTFAVFVLAAIALEFFRGARARRALSGGSWVGALAALIGRNRRRYGGYIVHAAIIVLLIGAVGIGAFASESSARLRPGESLRVGDYSVTYLASDQVRGANALELRARLDIARGEEGLGSIAAGKNRYLAEQQTSNEVAIRSDWLRGEDLFVIADRFYDDGSVFLRVLVNPLVNLIWLAGFVFLAGSLVTMWPDAREQARMARRFGTHAPGYTPA
jgi:cytochrome c-type biogenesis protein CcmF